MRERMPNGGDSARCHGFTHFGFGLGGGLNLNEDLDGERLSGGSGYIRLGGTTSQRLLLGFEGSFWGRDQGGASIARGNGTFTAMYYPSEKGGGFLKGGIGWATISRATTSGSATTTATESGFGLTLGAGWDIRLGRNLYLDTLDSAYGSGWKRENSFLTHAPLGSFCYGFYRHGSVAGDGTRYRITAMGPGATPVVTWEGPDPGPYSAARDDELHDLQRQVVGSDPRCQQR